MANQPAFIPSVWAASNTTTLTIPATTSETGKASWEQGFPVETSLPLTSGGIPPKYGDFNGVLKALSEFAVYAQSGGQYSYASTLDYSVGSIVVGTDGYIYRAAQANGPSTTVKNPVGDTSGTWEKIVSQSDLSAITSSLGAVTSTANDAYANASAANGAVTTLDANVVKLSGNQNVGGVKTFSNGIVAAYEALKRPDNTTGMWLFGGSTADASAGAKIMLHGGLNSTVANQGAVLIQAGNSSGYKQLWCKPDGTLSWDGKGFVYDSGAQVISGAKTFNDNVTIGLVNPRFFLDSTDTGVNAEIHFQKNGVDTGGVALAANDSVLISTKSGNTYWYQGACLTLQNNGYFDLRAKGSSTGTSLIGTPDGTLTWDGKNIITAAGGTMTGGFVLNGELCRSGNAAGGISIYNGTSPSDGGGIWIYGKSHSVRPGWILLQTYTTQYRSVYFDGTNFNPAASNIYSLGTTNNRWATIWQQNGAVTGSDERIKTSIEAIPDAVLDAWGEVDWRQFQMRDAVKKKGENARLHTGMIAQRIDDAFKAHGVDASRYGLFCHDSWEARDAEYDEKGEVTIPAIKAGDEYSLRYDEALCVEAAYQRRRADRAEARISALEQRLGELEEVLASLITPVGEEQTAEQEQEVEGADA